MAAIAAWCATSSRTPRKRRAIRKAASRSRRTCARYADIKRDVVTVGSLTRVEIWAKEKYPDRVQDADDFAKFVTELGLY